MQHRIGRQLEMLTRVEAMLLTRPELASVASSTARVSLSEMIASILAQVTQQDHGNRSSQGETARQHALLRALLVQMRALSSAARLKLRTSPELIEFKMPRSGSGVEHVLSAAQGMREAATRNEATLVSAGLKADFLVELSTAINAVRISITGRAGHDGTRSNATASIGAISSDIRHILRVLDALVLPLIIEQPGMLVEWRAAKRIGRKAGGSRTIEAPTSATVGAPAAIKEVLAPAA